MPATNTTCTLVAALVWGCLTLPAWGQDVHLLDCAQVQFFGPACVPVAPVTPIPPPPPSGEPLFSPETMAPDTPPLLLKLLQEPTRENARAFLDWQQECQTRLTEVQQLLRQLTRQRNTP
jgi:hypothetical protein